MVICNEKQCSGCFACANACPQHCILLKPDSFGALHPIIDEKQCCGCGRCQKVCPVNNPVPLMDVRQVFAAWLNDANKRKRCASGGIGSALAEACLANGGTVYGMAYASDWSVHCIRVEQQQELELLKGSKYVQGAIDDAYRHIQQDLKTGRQVLFTGTPCQVAGLKAIFGKNTPTNLITCDLVCHGVTPNILLQQEIKFMKKKYHLKNITDCRFRGNQEKTNFYFSLWSEDHCLLSIPAYFNYYFLAFLIGASLRDSCYDCPYAKTKRVGDITIGDFIGLGKKISFPASPENVSLVMCNTQHGEKYWQFTQREIHELKVIPRSIAEAVEGGISLRFPFPKHKAQQRLKRLCCRYGWLIGSRITLWRILWMHRLYDTPISWSWRIPRKIFRFMVNLFQ